MIPLRVDTERGRSAATAWAARADSWFRTRFDLEAEFVDLHLAQAGDAGSAPVLHALAVASTELWVDVSFLRLVIDRSESSDRLERIDSATIVELRWLAGAHARATLPQIWAGTLPGDGFSSRSGDQGETYDSELRSPYSTPGSTPTELGRNLVVRALTEMHEHPQIADDEFELVRLDGGRYLVVLPGVTDLSRLDLGLDPHHRTVRDVDRFAFASSRSAAVEDNRYAEMVWEALRSVAVPIGAELMIVGHSFGADTALDLAADPMFNGAAGFTVTHVVAAGYHSTPQLAHVDQRTEVLVLQNYRDAAVIGEAIGYGPVSAAVEEVWPALRDLRRLDLLGAMDHVGGFGSQAADATLAGARLLADRSGLLGRIALGVLSGRRHVVTGAVADLVTLRVGVEQIAERQVVDVFRGGSAGFGHAAVNYAEHVAATRQPALEAFFESVAASGYAGTGAAWAIDVSVPDDPG